MGPASRALPVLVFVLGTLGLAGCDQADTSDALSPVPTTTPTDATAVAANLLQVCDHAQDALRSGDLDDAAQSAARAAELQGMMDVAAPDAARALRPMSEAAAAIAADGRARATPKLQEAENRAYRVPRRTCIGAGSLAWN